VAEKGQPQQERNALTFKQNTDIPAAITLSFVFATIALMQIDAVDEGVAYVALAFGIFLSVYAVAAAALLYAGSKTPEQTVDAELYACTKTMSTLPVDESKR